MKKIVSMRDDEIVSIVCDNGSDRIKAGFAGDDAPSAVFPNIVESSNSPWRQYRKMYNMGMKDPVVGPQCL